MCTLSVIKNEVGLIMTMNRDEHRLRHESEKLSAVQLRDGCKVVFPTDLKSGGSWFGFNQRGVVLALLNRYQDPLKMDVISRGEIIPKALSQGISDNVFDFCGSLAVESYNPFDLIMISTGNCYQFKWTGNDYKIVPITINPSYFKTSSSVEMNSTLSWRSQFFEKWMKNNKNTINSESILKNIHLEQAVENKSRSIFMSREHSHSKSVCQVLLTNSNLVFQYYPQSSLMDITTELPISKANAGSLLLLQS